ncbi:MAG: TraB/GumN family protein [Rhizomicrobium sp.]
MHHTPFAIRHSLFAVLLGACVMFVAPFSAAADAPVRMADIAAHPALWTVRSNNATAYLFGSIHLLPTNIAWHTGRIDAALDAADIFVFEAPMDDAGKAAVADFIRKYGSLPAGTTLPSLLGKDALKDYRRALALAHVAPETLDHERPWLAEIVIDVAYLQQLHYMVEGGVDRQIFALAEQRKKPVRAFETPEQQLALFMPKDTKLEIAEFDADLKQFQSEQSTIGAMVDAWDECDVKSVGRLMNKELDSVPGAKKALIDDRNAAWVKQLDTMLQAHATYFITVGAGHLVGPHGVPALLRAQGYRVEGP